MDHSNKLNSCDFQRSKHCPPITLQTLHFIIKRYVPLLVKQLNECRVGKYFASTVYYLLLIR